jgi:hypothetical protein
MKEIRRGRLREPDQDAAMRERYWPHTVSLQEKNPGTRHVDCEAVSAKAKRSSRHSEL